MVLDSMFAGVSVWLVWSGIRVAGFSQFGDTIEKSQATDNGCSLQHGYHSNPTTPKLQHTSNQEKYNQCGNSTE